MPYTFENNFGDRRIIAGDINWVDDFKWTLGKDGKKKHRNIEVMPLGNRYTCFTCYYVLYKL